VEHERLRLGASGGFQRGARRRPVSGIREPLDLGEHVADAARGGREVLRTRGRGRWQVGRGLVQEFGGELHVAARGHRARPALRPACELQPDALGVGPATDREDQERVGDSARGLPSLEPRPRGVDERARRAFQRVPELEPGRPHVADEGRDLGGIASGDRGFERAAVHLGQDLRVADRLSELAQTRPKPVGARARGHGLENRVPRPPLRLLGLVEIPDERRDLGRRVGLDQPPRPPPVSVFVVPPRLSQGPLRGLGFRLGPDRGVADLRVEVAGARVGAVVEGDPDLVAGRRDPSLLEVALRLVEKPAPGGGAGVERPLVVPHFGRADQREDFAELALLQESLGVF
jgi:hypothetical protein